MLESLSIEASKTCENFLIVWKGSSAHKSSIWSFSLKVEVSPTFQQLFMTLIELVYLQELHLVLVFEKPVIELWHSQRGEWFTALKLNGSLQSV